MRRVIDYGVASQLCVSLAAKCTSAGGSETPSEQFAIKPAAGHFSLLFIGNIVA